MRRIAPIRIFLCLLALLLPGGMAGAAGATNGPTILLRCGPGQGATNSMADFMYFLPLISIEPVTCITSPEDEQFVRILSSRRHTLGHAFTTTCEMEVVGGGWQKNVFDLGPAIRKHERQLQNGGSMKHRLKSIDIKGAGALTVEVEGTFTNDVSTVAQVRMRFNPRGHTSPVWINLCDIRRVDDDVKMTNEVMARVNTLTFRRKPGRPTMEVTVASIKDKAAGGGFWQNFKGGVEGLAANLFIPPLGIDAAGQKAMLEFGQALASGAASYTFPAARNLEGKTPH